MMEMSEKNIEERKEKEKRALATGTVGAISIFILFFGPQFFSEFDFTRQHQLMPAYIGFLGMLWFVGMSLEGIGALQFLWKYGSTKILASLIISCLLIVSGSKSSALINAVFGVDGSALPYTLALLIPINFILSIKWVFYALLIWSFILACDAYNENKFNGSIKWNSIYFIVSSSLIAAFLFFQSNAALGEKAMKIKAYKLAHQFDFSESYDCKGIGEGMSVLFLSPDHRYIISDNKLLIDESFQDFFTDNEIEDYPSIGMFVRYECDTNKALQRTSR